MTTYTSAQKETAAQFLKLAAFGQVDEAYAKHVSPQFKHHNAYFRGDRQSLLEAMKAAHVEMPNESFEIHQIIEEGDRVMTYSKVLPGPPESAGIAVVHIFRFDQDGKIIELWDVGQIIDKNCPNENGLF